MKVTSKFKTFRTVGYAYQIQGSDSRSTGGVHHHQVRRLSDGTVVCRILQSNGRFADASRSCPATPLQLEQIAAAK